MAQAGFDWLAIDLEHSTVGIETAQQLIQVVELSGCVPLVRLSSNDRVQAKRVMDAGAHGIIIPTVNSAEEAEQAVKAIRYQPKGFRGVGLGRAQMYGARFREYMKELEEYAIVVVMIEHRDGVEQAEKILRVPGVDAVIIGPYDLSASYGIPGQFDHPQIKDALNRIMKAARDAGVAPGIVVVHPPVDQVRDRLAQGFRFIAYCGDMLILVPTIRDAAASIRGFAAKLAATT
jgi:2-dehydro-3-deoxyglucarate aldolase